MAEARRLAQLGAALGPGGWRVAPTASDADDMAAGGPPLCLVVQMGVSPAPAAAATGEDGRAGQGRTLRIGDVATAVLPPAVPEYVPIRTDGIDDTAQVRPRPLPPLRCSRRLYATHEPHHLSRR
jgi:hypothetical protein